MMNGWAQQEICRYLTSGDVRLGESMGWDPEVMEVMDPPGVTQAFPRPDPALSPPLLYAATFFEMASA